MEVVGEPGWENTMGTPVGMRRRGVRMPNPRPSPAAVECVPVSEDATEYRSTLAVEGLGDGGGPTDCARGFTRDRDDPKD